MLLILAEMAVIADTEDAFQADARQFFYHNTSEWAVTNFEAARKAVAAGEVESNLKRKQSIYSLDISGWREEVHTSTPDSTKTEPSQPTELAAAA